jgi:hypothetical protein
MSERIKVYFNAEGKALGVSGSTSAKEYYGDYFASEIMWIANPEEVAGKTKGELSEEQNRAYIARLRPEKTEPPIKRKEGSVQAYLSYEAITLSQLIEQVKSFAMLFGTEPVLIVRGTLPVCGEQPHILSGDVLLCNGSSHATITRLFNSCVEVTTEGKKPVLCRLENITRVTLRLDDNLPRAPLGIEEL